MLIESVNNVPTKHKYDDSYDTEILSWIASLLHYPLELF